MHLTRERVVFSVTTTPDRIVYLPAVISQLLASRVCASAVYANIPDVYAKTGEVYDIPEALYTLSASDPRFVINRCPDHGPLTKLYPTLLIERDPSTIILLCDDDETYAPRSHSELVMRSRADHTSAFGYRGVIVGADGEWDSIEVASSNGQEVSFLETYAGVVYRRAHFSTEFKPPTQESACWTTDDVWIGAELAKNDIKRRLIPGNKYGLGGPVNAPIVPNNIVADIDPLFDGNATNNAACTAQHLLFFR
jgi:heat shock protein HspQ